MATIEEVLKETMKMFEVQAKDALETALSAAYEEYLPHVENDTYSNVRRLSERYIERFMADNLTEEDLKLDVTSKYSWTAEAVRKKMYEEHRDEITKMIGSDLQEEIDSLKSRLEDAYRRY